MAGKQHTGMIVRTDTILDKLTTYAWNRSRDTGVLIVCLLWALVYTANAAVSVDSLHYELMRAEILAHETRSETALEFLDAAAELASESLYDEALHLLAEFFEGAFPPSPTPVVDTVSPKPQRNLRPSWSARISFMYDDYPPPLLDTAGLSHSDTAWRFLDDDFLLTGSLRIGAEWRQPLSWVYRFAPFVYVATTRARARVLLQGASPAGRLDYRAQVEAQSRYATVDIAATQSLLADASLAAVLRPDEGRLRARIPLEVATERYSDKRPGYLSFVEYGIAPQLYLESSDLRRQAALSVLLRDRLYDAPFDSANVRTLGAMLSGGSWSHAFTLMGEARGAMERFERSNSPRRRDELSGYGHARVHAAHWLELGLDLRGRGFSESHAQQSLWLTADIDSFVIDSIETAYTLGGYTIDIKPSMRFLAKRPIGLFAALAYQRQRHDYIDSMAGGELLVPLYTGESSDALEPQAGITFRSGGFEARATLRLRREYIVTRLYSRGNGTDLAPRIELFWHATRRLFADAMVEYLYRRTDAGVTQHGFSLSCCAGLRW